MTAAPLPAEESAGHFDLWQYIPYLLNRAGRRIADAFGAELAPHGLSVAMWRVLAVLWHEGAQRLGDLAGLVTIELSTLSRLVGTLQRKGMVSRARSAADARAVRVELTPAGRALTAALIPLALRYEHAALAGLDATEIATLKRLLMRLYDNMAGLDGSADGEGTN